MALLSPSSPFTVAFERAFPYGWCVGLWLGPAAGEGWDAAVARLHADERHHLATLGARRQSSWLGGRLALRRALEGLGVSVPGPLLSTARGAPLLPSGVVGSITHKDRLAVALVARDEGWTIGVDLEEEGARGYLHLARRILTEREQQQLAALAPAGRERELLLRFSGKEAVYKAIDPFEQRYVGFHEVELETRPGGDFAVHLLLTSQGTPLTVEAGWTGGEELGPFLLTFARAAPRRQD